MEKFYTVHFEDEGTGENFDDYVFETKEEAYSHWTYEYPGYGRQYVKEISREEAIEILKEEINHCVDVWLNIDAIDLDPEDPLVDDKWIKEAEKYIERKDPGWKLLKEFIENPNKID